MTSASDHSEGLAGRRILLGVTGGIACYKAAALTSRLAQSGVTVTVMMTEAATRFVAPLTFQTLSGRPVYASLWQAEENHDSQHISLARNCDAVVLAPATANTMAKIAHGICDDLVSTVVCAVPQGVPVVVAPAMNADMWAHPITQENVAKLRDVLGYQMVGPGEGWQACRSLGAGRMSEADEIFEAVAKVLG